MSNEKALNRPRIGLALSGGAARGIAHVGVLRALEENAIPIDGVAGASAGALIGGAYASGLAIAQLEAMALKVRCDTCSPRLNGRGLHQTRRWRNFSKTPATNSLRLRIPLPQGHDLHTATWWVMPTRRPGILIGEHLIPVVRPGRDGDDGRCCGGLVANLPIRQSVNLAMKSIGRFECCRATFCIVPRRSWGDDRVS